MLVIGSLHIFRLGVVFKPSFRFATSQDGSSCPAVCVERFGHCPCPLRLLWQRMGYVVSSGQSWVVPSLVRAGDGTWANYWSLPVAPAVIQSDPTMTLLSLDSGPDGREKIEPAAVGGSRLFESPRGE